MDKLKKDFIESFGEEKWIELEKLKPLQDAVDLVSREYLGIDPIPVVFEKIEGDISRYDFKLQAIILNSKYINDYEELLDSCFHELEHHWRRLYIACNDTPKARRWKNELENYNRLDVTQEIEIYDYINSKRILSDD